MDGWRECSQVCECDGIQITLRLVAFICCVQFQCRLQLASIGHSLRWNPCLSLTVVVAAALCMRLKLVSAAYCDYREDTPALDASLLLVQGAAGVM